MRNINLLTLALLLLSASAQATILWAGGEDLDFPNGPAVGVNITGSYYRSGSYARESLYVTANGNISTSNVFAGGAITSGWLSARVGIANFTTSAKYIGLGFAGTNYSLWVGSDSATNTKVALWTYDGTTWTELASESSGTLNSNSSVGNKIDMQVIGYNTGASAQVNIYTQGTNTARIAYTGTIAVGGNTSLNEVMTGGCVNCNYNSEIIVATTDTRTMSLATLAPNAAGATNTWTSAAYGNINPTTINTAVNNSDTTSGDVFECKMNSLPAGNFSVQAVKLSAYGLKTVSGPGSLSLGVYTNATIEAPTAVGLLTTWSTVETLYTTSPYTSSAWTTTDVNNLQLNLQSAP